VATGKVASPTEGHARLISHIRATVETDPDGKWIFIVDQLNTHKSAGWVQLIAQLCLLDKDLGVKGQPGILKDMG
jgi:putative transposase